ncbi:hypothetical protein EUX98_g6027 [Antrodiella citrinella]|uniref:Uncharacterized protein n=1 Tax=Antrodiella citrinella TaxID=2447956 RepID=A0A4S4MS76_9APHY|nr:hypothetical protein EUX98_g6027 [Antrodiella citrinella]
MTDESTSHNGSTSDHIEDSDVSLERAISDIPVLRNLKFSEVPHVDTLDALLHADLIRSLDFDPSDLRAVASSARLWEGLIQQGFRLPFLLCKVAEVRWRLGSKVTAIQLYEEANAECGDVSLGRWIRAARSAVWRQTGEILDAYKDGSVLTIVPGQGWRSTVIYDTHFLPSLIVEEALVMAQIHEVWERGIHTEICRRYYNFFCMHTIALEGVCLFSEDVIYEIAAIGFDRIREINLRMLPQAHYIEEGTVRELDDAISILQDTHKVLIFNVL